MKPTKDSHQQERSKRSLYRPASSRAETAVLATLGLVALGAVVVAVLSASVPARSKDEKLADQKRLPMVKYVRGGQLIADVRTVASMVHYLFTVEPPAMTNVSERWPVQQSLMESPNAAAVEPKA